MEILQKDIVCVDGVIILDGSINTKKKTTETLIFARKKTGLEIKTDKTKYMVKSRDKKQDKVTILIFIIKTLKGWNFANDWEEP